MATLTSQLIVRLIDGISGPARAAASSLRGIGAAARSVSGGASGLAATQQKLASAIQVNNEKLAATRGQLVDAAAGFAVLAGAVAAPLKAAAAFESRLDDIRQKGDLTRDAMFQVGKAIRELAPQVNQSASSLAAGVDVLLGLGASKDDALELMPDIGKAATAYQTEINDLANAGYAALSNLQVPANQFGKALDSMAAAGKAGAFELRDMAKYFPALGAAYQGLGQKGVPAVADLAAALQVARKGAGDSAEAATNVGNVLQKINSPQTRAKFAKMGVDLEKEMAAAAAKGMTPIEAIAEITHRTLKGNLGRLGDLFEDAQVQKGLRPLIQNMEEYRRIRADAMKAQGAVDADFTERMKTAAANVQRLQIAMERASLAIGEALVPALVSVGEALAPVVERLVRFAEANPVLTRAVFGTVAGLLALRVGLIGVRFVALMAKGGLLSLVMPVVRLGAAAQAAAGANLAYQASLAAMAGTSLTAGQRVAAAIGGMVRAVPGVAMLASGLKAVGVATAAVGAVTAPVVAVVAALAAGGLLVWRYWDRVSSVMAGVGRAIGEQLAPALEMARPVLEWLAPVGDLIAKGWAAATSALKSFGEWLGGFFSREVLSDGAKAAWEQAGYEVATALIESVKSKIMELVEWFRGLPGRIVAAIGRIDIGSLIKWPSLPSWLGGGEAAPAAPAGQTPPARASGGHVTRGRTYLVGERRPELFTPSRDGYVHSRVPQGGGSGATVTVNQTFNVSGLPDPQGFVDSVKAALRRDIQEGLRGVMADTGLKFT